MFVLVPVQAAEPVRQPQNVRSYAPNPVTGYGQPPAMNNVIPFRQVESCQLVPTGVDRFGRPVDGYADYLAGLPDLDPSAIAGRVGFDVHGLVPGEDDQARLEHLHHPADVSDRNPNAVARDPVADARGSRGFLTRRTSPYLAPGGAGPGSSDGS